MELRRALQMRMEQIQAQILEDERTQRQITNDNDTQEDTHSQDDSTTAEENKLLQTSMH